MLPGLLEEKDLRDYYRGIRVQAKRAGFELVAQGPNQFFQEEISYTTRKDELIVFVHVPVVASVTRRRLVLYRHVQLPILSNHTAALVKGPGSLLAVDKENELSVELTPSYLQACVRHGQDFWCSAVFPRLRGGESSCLAALYLHHAESAHRWCRQEAILEETKAFRVNATAFVLWTKHERTVNVRCETDLVAEQFGGGLELILLQQLMVAEV